MLDALGHTRQSTYTPDDQPQSLTDALSASTQLSYDQNYNLTKATAPASAQGQSSASDTFTYPAFSSASELNYLPNSNTDAQGSCRAFSYDPHGNLTEVYDGGASGCREV